MSAVRPATASTRAPQKPPTSTCGTAGGRKRARGLAVAVILVSSGAVVPRDHAPENGFPFPANTPAASLVRGNKACLNLPAKRFRLLAYPIDCGRAGEIGKPFSEKHGRFTGRAKRQEREEAMKLSKALGSLAFGLLALSLAATAAPAG